jgi:hypothetical protein
MKILLGDFSENTGRGDILTPTGNESFHEISNDSGVRELNFATSNNIIIKSTTFSYHSIHKYIRTYLDGKTHIIRSLLDR